MSLQPKTITNNVNSHFAAQTPSLLKIRFQIILKIFYIENNKTLIYLVYKVPIL